MSSISFISFASDKASWILRYFRDRARTGDRAQSKRGTEDCSD